MKRIIPLSALVLACFAGNAYTAERPDLDDLDITMTVIDDPTAFENIRELQLPGQAAERAREASRHGREVTERVSQARDETRERPVPPIAERPASERPAIAVRADRPERPTLAADRPDQGDIAAAMRPERDIPEAPAFSDRPEPPQDRPVDMDRPTTDRPEMPDQAKRPDTDHPDTDRPDKERPDIDRPEPGDRPDEQEPDVRILPIFE